MNVRIISAKDLLPMLPIPNEQCKIAEKHAFHVMHLMLMEVKIHPKRHQVPAEGCGLPEDDGEG